jgi:hypothetical protein
LTPVQPAKPAQASSSKIHSPLLNASTAKIEASALAPPSPQGALKAYFEYVAHFSS